ncbi:LysE family translocator [Pantoea phytobeneficialis]|uniref:LysE family translocator n=1 Tax=Pantoea phytobeneficialis TaxID=2052056 RepID=A0AAP9KPA4_9GAMM|nr:LysE family translocator [Pantoea phytobeneficialis]MDO6406022.1 LysE family translocator [Pantoea phytobeneficialis]QGR06658.1 lysine transporter LysE [Pantoea phytobeneficialis]
MDLNLIAFIIAILPVALSPGASFTLAINNTLSAGSRGLAAIIVGTALGIYTHALLIGSGISALLLHSPRVFTLLSFAGSLYLFWLGVQLIKRGRNVASPYLSARPRQTTMKEAWLANVLNPKAVMLYLTVVSQFAGKQSAFAHFLLLATVHILIMSLWLVLVCFALLTSAKLINIQKMGFFINVIGGAVLVIFAMHNFAQLLLKLMGLSW